MSAHLLIPGDHEPVGCMCRLDQMSVLCKGTRNSRRSSSPGERLAEFAVLNVPHENDLPAGDHAPAPLPGEAALVPVPLVPALLAEHDAMALLDGRERRPADFRAGVRNRPNGSRSRNGCVNDDPFTSWHSWPDGKPVSRRRSDSGGRLRTRPTRSLPANPHRPQAHRDRRCRPWWRPGHLCGTSGA